MNSDLISREALKEAIENYLEKRQDVIIWETDMLNMLDNAPTVAKDYDTGYQDGLEDGLNDIRPQGEWMEIDSRVNKAICSNCKGTILTEPYGKPNFCPNCGADMRGEEE